MLTWASSENYFVSLRHVLRSIFTPASTNCDLRLDDVSEINGEVPTFLAQMRSESPAYLLKTPDESAAIELVSKDWQGALPFTILFNAQGETIYSKQGKFKPDVLEAAIEKL